MGLWLSIPDLWHQNTEAPQGKMTAKPQGVTSLLSLKAPLKCGLGSHFCRDGTHPKQHRDPLTSAPHTSGLIVPPGPRGGDNSLPLPALGPCSPTQGFPDEVSPLAQILGDVPRRNPRMSRVLLGLNAHENSLKMLGTLGRIDPALGWGLFVLRLRPKCSLQVYAVILKGFWKAFVRILWGFWKAFLRFFAGLL